MVVEIDKDVIEYLQKSEKELTFESPAIRMLNEIANQCYNRHHIISAEIDVLEFLKDFPLLETLTRRVFSSLLDKNYLMGEYRRRVSFVIRYYAKSAPSREDNCIWLPILKYCPLSKAILLCENLSDCSFYIDFVKESLEEKGEDNILISLRKLSCAGSEAEKTIENEINNHVCAPILCVMDSDKCEENAPIGRSAQSAEDAFDAYKNLYPIQLHILNVRAKENIIPPTILIWEEKLAKNPLLVKLSQKETDPDYYELLRYINIKDGIKNFQLFRDCAKYKTQIEKLGYKWPDADAEKDKKYFAEGIGSRALDLFRKNQLRHHLQAKLDTLEEHGCDTVMCNKIRADVARSHQLTQYMPSYLKNDWINIENLVVTFGMAFPETVSLIS